MLNGKVIKPVFLRGYTSIRDLQWTNNVVQLKQMDNGESAGQMVMGGNSY